MAPPSKRRRIEVTATEEITFDPKLRKEYLTGFHKRKVQRTKEAREYAVKKAREEKIEDRKKLREERQAELERHVQAINAQIRPTDDSDDADEEKEDGEHWNGIESSPEVEAVDHEAEYIDEDKYTTVTVEALDVTREGLFKAEQQKQRSGAEEEDGPDHGPSLSGPTEKALNISGKRKWTKENPKADIVAKLKKKRKKFRYETKAERKVTLSKERLRNHNKKARARARTTSGG